MKTKKFLMLLAAMLLSCTSAFAQNGNNTPVKGDVNEDGTVDVADIVAVIDIMKNGGGTATVGYFYLGTTKPTAANYKTLPGVVTSFASIDDAIGTKVSVAAGQTIYMLCPAAWVKGKKVTLEDKSGNIVDFLDEKDETTVSDYVIYKTQVLNAPNDVVLKQEQEYYWYVGTTPIDDTNYNNTTIVSQVTEIPASTNVTLNTDDYLYIVAPKTKTVTVLDANTQGIVNIKTYNSETHTFTYAETFVDDYKIYKSAQTCLGPFIINISDTYYFYVGTTKPTSLEYQGVTTVNEYPAEQLYTNETGSYSKIYILTKNDKTVTIYDANLGGMGELDDPDTITIPGYIIWTTYDEIPNTGKIKIRIS